MFIPERRCQMQFPVAHPGKDVSLALLAVEWSEPDGADRSHCEFRWQLNYHELAKAVGGQEHDVMTEVRGAVRRVFGRRAAFKFTGTSGHLLSWVHTERRSSGATGELEPPCLTEDVRSIIAALNAVFADRLDAQPAP